MSRYERFEISRSPAALSRVLLLALLVSTGAVCARDTGTAATEPKSEPQSTTEAAISPADRPEIALRTNTNEITQPAAMQRGGSVIDSSTAIEDPDDVVVVWGSRIIDPGPAKPATVEMTATNYRDCTVAGMKVKVLFKVGPNLSDATAYETTLAISRPIGPKQSIKWRQIVDEVRGHGARAPLKHRWYTQFLVVQARGVACLPVDKSNSEGVGTEWDVRSPADSGESDEFFASLQIAAWRERA